MPRITSVTTRTGDDGTTALGGGQRLPKDALRIEAYGTADELNSVLGVVLASQPCPAVAAVVRRLQNELFHLGADLCVIEEDKAKRPGPRIEERHVAALEADAADLGKDLPPLANFVLPGGAAAAAHLHVARTVCRRAERLVVRLAREEPVGPWIVPYLNRLSDLLFVASRAENRARGTEGATWDSRA